MKRIVNAKIFLIVIFTLFIGLYAMPSTWKEKIPFENLRNQLIEKKVGLGLDLAGGRQLDWKIDLSKVRERNNDDDPSNDVSEKDIINGVVETLRRRIDPDGTRELVIQASSFADEHHVIVELTADIDNEETRAKLQKSIDLQFKELKSDADENEKEKSKNDAEKSLEQLLGLENKDTFAEEAQKIAETNKNATFEEQEKFRDELPVEVADKIWDLENGTITSEIIENQKGYMIFGQDIVPDIGYSIFQVGEKNLTEREKTIPPEDFEIVRSEVSESDNVKLKVADLSQEIKEKILVLSENEVSEIFENDEQYAIYKLLPLEEEDIQLYVSQLTLSKSTENAKEKIDNAFARLQEKTETTQEEKISFKELYFRPEVSPWKDTALTGQYFRIAKVDQNQFGFPIVSIQFDTEGAKLFEEITERNIGKPLAIFVGGDFISSPNVNEKISGGSAQITFGTKNFIDAKKEAITLARNLNAGAIPAPVELVGEVKVEASLGADALEASIFAGIVGLIGLSLWMIFIYRVLGIVAVLALGIYALIILFILKVTTLFVLTLAGVAGIILSIGMAVDANILIFERIREELKDGKNFSAALDIGFDRAWTSIRDSNVSSLITCAILWWFGTSIVKGFAVMLALGIIISMITAITITRTLLSGFVGTKISTKTDMFARSK